MNDKLFSVNYRNQHLDDARKITVDDLNFQAYRPTDGLEPIHVVPNPAGTFSHPNPNRFTINQ